MSQKIGAFLKKPENLTYVFFITLSIIIAIFDIFGMVDLEIVTTTILVVLSALLALMMITNQNMSRMQGKLQESVDDFFQSFDELSDELKDAMKSAEEIWLLSRTGRGWWKNYRYEIENILTRKRQNRFLFINPQNGALKMVERTSRSEWSPTSNFSAYRSHVEGFLNWLSENNSQNSYTLKVIDHLPACTLIILNPNKKNNRSVIYVELSNYNSGSKTRPVFKIKPQDTEYFSEFIEEFEKMWQDAKTWPLRAPVQKNRQAVSVPVNVVKLELALDFQQFILEEQSQFIVKLSRIINVNPDAVRILDIASNDSVFVTLEMPEKSAALLLTMFLIGDSNLKALPITKVEQIDNPVKATEPNRQVVDWKKGLTTNVPQVNLANLREFTANYFNESELKDICFDLDVDYESLPGEGKRDKARELVAFFERRGQINKFVLVCCKRRPNIAITDLVK